MPAFDYTAYNKGGKQVSGVVSADSLRQARRTLKDQQLLPLNVSEVSAGKTGKDRKGVLRGKARLSEFDLSLLLRQQSILIQSGLPLEEALRMTIEQAETTRQRRVVENWRAEIIEGRSLSDALRRCQYRIPESVIAGLAVGEESGHLSEIMMRLADELETSAENRKAITRALIYPATLIITSIVVVAVMMVWVVPKITVIFTSSQREMPLVTRVVIGLSEFTQHYGLYVLVLVVGLFLYAKWLLRNPVRRQRWHGFLLRMPGLGRWLTMAAIADWARSMGTLLKNGVPALAALKISSTVVDNLEFRARMEKVTDSMRKGSSLHRALADNGAGSGFLVHMVSSGETSSELDKMLLRVADYYALRLNSAVDVFLKIINPVLIVIMGLIILSVVAAVMLPIMDMNNMI